MSRIDDIRKRVKNNMILFAKDRHDMQYLLDQLAKAERRAEAAEAAIPHICDTCKFYGVTGCIFNTKDFCVNYDTWEWRGPQEDE